MVSILDRETYLGVGVWLSPGLLVLREKNQTKLGQDGEPMEEEQYLFQLQIDWDHCRVCRLRLLAGTGPVGSSVAEGREKRKEKKKRARKTASYILGGMNHRSQDVSRSDREIKAMGWLLKQKMH